MRFWGFCLAVLWVLGIGAQANLTVDPSQIQVAALEKGDLLLPHQLTITAPNSWTAHFQPSVNWATISPASGTGNTKVVISFVGSSVARLAPGIYETTLIVTPSSGEARSVPVRLRIAARLPPPRFTYLFPDGPRHCEFPSCTSTVCYPDPALCQVPEERPPGNFTPPPPGGYYFDPNFGSKVTILSGPPSNHAYSSPTAISANNKYTLITAEGGMPTIINNSTFKIVASNVPINWTTLTFWDAFDDEIYYFFSGPRIEKFDLQNRRRTTLIDYSRSETGYRFSSITSGGTGDASKDNWIAFWAPQETHVCAADLKSLKTYCYNWSSSGQTFTNVDFAMMAKGVDSSNGKRYVLLMARPSMGVFSVNEEAGKLDLEYRGPEEPIRPGNWDGNCDPGESCISTPHSDTFEDSDGIQYLIYARETQSPCEYALYSLELRKGREISKPVELGGGAKRLLTLFSCGTRWVDHHVGCARRSPYCVVSTTYVAFGGRRRDPADQTPINRTPHLSEVFVVHDNGRTIRRLMQHRSVEFSNEPAGSYWTTPRACISDDGAYVVLDSNFGEPNQVRTVLVETGLGEFGLKRGGLVNSASYEAKISPGGFATIFGTALTNCYASADRVPLPNILCGAWVVFNGLRSHIAYASPNQLNVTVPRDLNPNAPLRMTLVREGEDPVDKTYELDAGIADSLSPAIFQYALEDGVARAVAQNSDYSLNGPSGGPGTRPLRINETGILYANGLGATSPSVRDGDPSPEGPLARVTAEVKVFVNGVAQRTDFAGLTPRLVALYQINFTLLPGTPIRPEGQNEIWLSVDGIVSPRLVISLAVA